jgi:O-methyltransferase
MSDRYIELLKSTLTDYHKIGFVEYKPLSTILDPSWKMKIMIMCDRWLSKQGYSICKKIHFREEDRKQGRDWPSQADTMIGMMRLNNLEFCIREVIKNNIEGDLIETGVWRGGATIFMKAVLNTLGNLDKIVWVADSFEGLPKPNADKYTADRYDEHYKIQELAVSLEDVKKNFIKYDLLDDRVKFLKGWFSQTLPTAPIDKLSILRLDGDMYESTMDALENLYHKLSPGGFIIIDDWSAVKGCKLAVEDFRKKYSIVEKMIEIDWSSIYWQKTS